MALDRPLLIVNPRSGGGLSESRWARLAGAVAEGLGPFDTQMTERPDHAQELAREAALAGRHLVVAVGGDGTLNEVVNGLMAAGAPRTTEVALLPRGTGGDFRRTLDLPHDFTKAGRRIAQSQAKPVDVGLVKYVDHSGQPASRYFVNVSSFGFSASVASKANASSKKLGARSAFLGATVRTVFGYSNLDVQVSIDDAAPLRRTVLLGAIGNGRFFGGGMKICPDAVLDSGSLQFVVVGDLGLGAIATKIHRLYDGTHLKIDRVDGRQIRCVSVAPAEGQAAAPVEVDGETPGTLPATWEVIPAALMLRA
ncbi:MAG: diacylglycerol kinase family lipid kinase [Deltaproteobacteria bacterium]|nr:diacylglycerol kinase family lipid kinase [Deltaproteobacteria bacterium]